ncbi:MAG: hypothetical protein FJ271_27110 [Planctomycetes bacterium]|nr:hypothetical protein [Planctomycetota bacterium]
MRMTSLIVLLAIVGGIGYVLIFKRDWIFSKAKEGLQLAQGYTPAKSPREAMELFMKAVKERNYDAASKYVTGDYEEKLRKAHAGASELGGLIDAIHTTIEDKGFKDEKVTFVLYNLDPFPKNFKIGEIKETKDKDKAVGAFVLEQINLGNAPPPEIKSLDFKMFTNGLRNPVVGPNPTKPGVIALEIKAVKKGEGDEKQWLIDVPMNQVQHDQILYFTDHYKRYVSGMKEFRDRLRQGRYLKDQVLRELTEVLRASK